MSLSVPSPSLRLAHSFADIIPTLFSVPSSQASSEYPPYVYGSPNNQPQSPIHAVSSSPRVEAGQRKRPKYTRSKTGCMTCRGKKIKVRRALLLYSLSYILFICFPTRLV